MTTPTPVSRGEFGVIGATRILALLKKHGIPATWFIPGHTLETYPEACLRVLEAGHEIGHHGWTHVPPASLSREQEEAELARANEQIKKLTGRYARGYRSPSWDLSPHSVELLLEHGFYYESSMMGNDYSPYRVRLGDRIELQKPAVFGKESRLIEMPVSWSLDDYPHFEFVRTQNAVLPGLQNAGGVLANWIDDFLYLKRDTEWGIITYTFHPFVIGRGHRMMALERLIDRLAAEGAEFMRMDAAAESFDERSPYK
ncbi:MAG: polysaccharide deacetylase [Betaproteobacteria bacterium]|nr:MAG: polysaccharide deacetylase [Betaproteobacteria bacterium]